jgi:DNA-binding winged helix-turn-helix (wHTH) protein
VTQGTTSAHLTPKELDLLRQLTQHANEVVSPDHPEYITTEPWIDYRFNGVIESS